MLKKIIFSICLLTSMFNGFSQEKPQSKTINHTIDSKIFGKERKIDVYLPEQYTSDSTKKMIVAYVFDSQFPPYFNMVNSINDYYSLTEETIPMIIVGVHSEVRWFEFTPENMKNDTLYEPTNKLMRHLEQEVFPLIEKNYRTEKFRLGIGHSLGGTFLLYSIFKQNPLFHGVIAASPNMVISGSEDLVKLGKNFLKKFPDNNTFVHVESGTEGTMEQGFTQSILHFDSIVRQNNFPDFDWSYTKVEKGNHMTTFVPSLSNGLIAFNSKWKISEKERIKVNLADSSTIQQEILNCFKHHEKFTRKPLKLTVNNVQIFNNFYEEIGDFETSRKVLKFAYQFCDSDSTLKDKISTKDHIQNQMLWNQFLELTSKAKIESDLKNYVYAKQLYDEAFKLDVLRGTFMQRIQSLDAYALTNDTESAFEQLRLLAEYFHLRGSRSFINNPNLVSLHQDKRWKKYIKIIDKNNPE
jgi:predicted alpha/beta superfamily hydrolase